MNALIANSCAAALGGLLLLSSAVAIATVSPNVPGESLDSGLGELPHYSKWVDPTGKDPLGSRVIGEKLDSGLGEMGPYRAGQFANAGRSQGE